MTEPSPPLKSSQSTGLPLPPTSGRIQARRVRREDANDEASSRLRTQSFPVPENKERKMKASSITPSSSDDEEVTVSTSSEKTHFLQSIFKTSPRHTFSKFLKAEWRKIEKELPAISAASILTTVIKTFSAAREPENAMFGLLCSDALFQSCLIRWERISQIFQSFKGSKPNGKYEEGVEACLDELLKLKGRGIQPFLDTLNKHLLVSKDCQEIILLGLCSKEDGAEILSLLKVCKTLLRSELQSEKKQSSSTSSTIVPSFSEEKKENKRDVLMSGSDDGD